MQKILLVIDNYGEMVQLEQMLKKLGFDTVGMHSPLSFQDQLLGFSPDVVVLSARGAKVHGLELSQRIKKRKGSPKIILLFPQGFEPQPTELASAQMDAVFESPIDPLRFLGGLCKLTGIDSGVVLEKFAKMQGFGADGEYGTHHSIGPEGGHERIHVGGGGGSVDHTKPKRDRATAYREIAAQVSLSTPGGLPHDHIQAAIKEWRKQSVPEQDADLDASRREFVRALFGKHR